MSAGLPRTRWQPDVTLEVKCKIHTANRMLDNAYRVDTKSASLAAGSLKIKVRVIYFPPSFQRNTKKSIVLRVLELRSLVFDNNIMFRGETRNSRPCPLDTDF
jgi:hypothetical protein